MEIRPAQIAEAGSIVALALGAFDEFIAPDYSEQGIAHFHANVTTDRLIASMNEGNIVLVGTVGGVLAGVVTLRDETHISWLYVDKAYQGQGIGLKLVADAAEQVMLRTPGATMITLNASPYAVPIYFRMGFEAAGPEITKDGMRMTPMRANIESLI